MNDQIWIMIHATIVLLNAMVLIGVLYVARLVRRAERARTMTPEGEKLPFWRDEKTRVEDSLASKPSRTSKARMDRPAQK